VWASGSTEAASEFIYIFSIWIKRYRLRQKYQALMNVTSVSFSYRNIIFIRRIVSSLLHGRKLLQIAIAIGGKLDRMDNSRLMLQSQSSQSMNFLIGSKVETLL